MYGYFSFIFLLFKIKEIKVISYFSWAQRSNIEGRSDANPIEWIWAFGSPIEVSILFSDWAKLFNLHINGN